MDVIYLDDNATTRLAPESLEAMMPYLTEWYGNASSVHRFGQRSRRGVDEARGRVAELIGCAEGELCFTGGGTEAINMAVRGLLGTRRPRKRIVISTVEHSATRELCAQLAKEGAEIVEVPVNGRGELDMERLAEALTEETALASIMWANNETGVVFPVERIAVMCRQRGVPFHCDGTQAVGKIPVNVKDAGLDAMSLAGHKFHGPKGVGALYARRGLRVGALIVGGPQERGRRGGTENVAGIVGMGAAAVLAGKGLEQMAQVAALRDSLEARVLSTVEGTAVNGAGAPRLPNTSNIGFARLEAEAILLLLSEQGICASAGAACASGSLEPSHVLKAMGVDGKLAHGAVRFSLSRYTTEEEVETTTRALPALIEKLRNVLPVG